MVPRGRKRAGGSKGKPMRGKERFARHNIATLRPTKWINDSIVNFVGEIMMQPWRGRGTAKVHVFSSHLMDTLLGGADPIDPYDFAAVGRWCDRVPGGISSLNEIFIPVNPNGNHWNFIHVRVQAKKDRAVTSRLLKSSLKTLWPGRSRLEGQQ